MNVGTPQWGALISGLTFVVAGTLFLLDRTGVLSLDVNYLWPIILIGLGAALLVDNRSATQRHKR